MINNGNIYNDFDVVADSTTPNVDQLTDLFALPVPTPTPPIFYDNYANNGYSSSNSPNDIFACPPTVIPGNSQQQQSAPCNYYPAQGPTLPAFFDDSFKTAPKPGAGHIFVNLIILDQPVDRCRFRYKAEQGPHGALRAVSSNAASSSKMQKFVPKVKVDNLIGNGYVAVSLWTNEPVPRPHVNELWGSECENGTCKIKLNAEMTARWV
uniref:RHD domain-containing protein n=1 Tax=Romanomermis culicivorax TaxID=13658 RepID=A0A915ISE9_ROMCU